MSKIKLNAINIFLVVGFTLSIFCLSFIISSNYKNYKYVIEENEFYDNFNNFSIYSNKEVKLSNITKTLEDNNIHIYSTPQMIEQTKIGEDIYANKVMGVSKYFDINKYTKIKGRNFIEKDFIENRKVAIIGNTLNKALEKEGNNEYIELYGEQYKIIGVIYDSDYLAFSSFIPINTMSYYNNSYDNFFYWIDKEDSKNFNYTANNEINYDISSIPSKNILEFVMNNSLIIEESIIDLILSILTLILFCIFYVYSIRKEFSIMRILGAKPIDILLENIKKLIPMYLISLLLGLITSYVVVYISNKYINDMFASVDINNILITIVVSFLIVIIVSFICLYRVMRFKILEDIR